MDTAQDFLVPDRSFTRSTLTSSFSRASVRRRAWAFKTRSRPRLQVEQQGMHRNGKRFLQLFC
jgi:hypothetical protein